MEPDYFVSSEGCPQLNRIKYNLTVKDHNKPQRRWRTLSKDDKNRLNAIKAGPHHLSEFNQINRATTTSPE